jgi:aryl-alcohol dehydrogenase
MAARLSGCSPIVAADRFDGRLDLAMELGATHAVNTETCTDLSKHLRSFGGFDFALDTSADFRLRATALKALGRNGAGASLGYGMLPRFDAEDRAMQKSWDGGVVEGYSVPQAFIPFLLDLYRQGRFPIDRLVTRFPFEQINEAFDAGRTGRVVKPVVVMG